MSVPVAPSQHRIRKVNPFPVAVPLAVLAVTAGAAGGAAAAAPDGARTWVLATIVVAWGCLALTVLSAALVVRRSRRGAASAATEALTANARLTAIAAETAQLVNVTLPAVLKRLRDGASAEESLATAPQPADLQLRQVLRLFAGEIAADEQRAEKAVTANEAAVGRLAEAADGLDRLMTKTLPEALDGLRQGGSADTVLGRVEPPADPRLRVLLDSLIREFAVSERRAMAAQAASAKALSRVQAKAVSMLADLREMQDRYGEEVFGDLLKLDHNTSQLGLLTDRLALLMGGRASRAWNRPIGMESILRGAVGRIAAYRRVRMHCSSDAAIVGFAAEGVMHLLAELMDNAANFSPPIDEVHVYVEERTAGIVVTIEDSGLKMADAAMRRAEESVSGRSNDLATLRGTRLGLAVVGRLAAKYRTNVSFRPSSRGGTGVVVLIPPQLLAQQQGGIEYLRRPAAELPVPPPAAPRDTAAPAPATTAGPRVATPGGLPVRPPGRTMAAADRDRPSDDAGPGMGPGTGGIPPARDAGAQFGAFHRSRRSPEGPGAEGSAAP